MKKIKIRQLLQILLVAGIIALILRIFVMDSFVVRGDSMAPTILDGDYVFVNKLYYYFKSPDREDVVVVDMRPTQSTHSNRLIKRIIGLPGERVELADNQVLIKNNRKDSGISLRELYLNFSATPALGFSAIQLDKKEYFVMGDNRYASIDSRELGPIDEWSIEGRIYLIFRPYPLSIKFF